VKPVIFGTLIAAIFALSAYAVSLDYKYLSAIEIGELATERSNDGSTTITYIDFSGPELVWLYKALPEVKDEDNQPMPAYRSLVITNAGQEGVAADKTTQISIECTEVLNSNGFSCTIYVISGVIPG
jgi:hypothetical protein